MKSLAAGLVLCLFAVLSRPLPAQPTDQSVRFRAVDIFIDSHETPLAAYQLEFSVTSGNAKVVGVEGGEPPAFKEAPFYDPKAIQQQRVIIAAFNTAAVEKLPTGKTRVATIHLQVAGDGTPQCILKLTTAASTNGARISTQATVEERKTK